MTDDLTTTVTLRRAQRLILCELFNTHGRLHAISKRDPTYAVLLTRNTTSDAPYRVTSFRDGEPIGHREYRFLSDGGTIDTAISEFMGDGWEIVHSH